MLPTCSYVRKCEFKTVKGTKLMMIEERVTLHVTTNTTRTDKVPLSIIDKSKNPQCIKNKTKHLSYYYDANAWSDC